MPFGKKLKPLGKSSTPIKASSGSLSSLAPMTQKTASTRPGTNLSALTPRSGKNTKDPLAERYQMNEKETSLIREVLPDHFQWMSFAKMSFHIRGLGFSASDIITIVQVLKENSLDKENWLIISKVNKHTANIEIALYAYLAGLSIEDIKNMPESQLTISNLKVMINLRDF